MSDQSFDYVVANTFAAAINVKVWVNNKEFCQVILASCRMLELHLLVYASFLFPFESMSYISLLRL